MAEFKIHGEHGWVFLAESNWLFLLFSLASQWYIIMFVNKLPSVIPYQTKLP